MNGQNVYCTTKIWLAYSIYSTTRYILEAFNIQYYPHGVLPVNKLFRFIQFMELGHFEKREGPV